MLISLGIVPTVPEAVLFFGKFLCAATRAEDYANLALLLHRHSCGIEACILDRFRGSGNREWHYSRNVFAFTCVHPCELIELRNFACDVYWQRGRIETRDAFHSGLAG